MSYIILTLDIYLIWFILLFYFSFLKQLYFSFISLYFFSFHGIFPPFICLFFFPFILHFNSTKTHLIYEWSRLASRICSTNSLQNFLHQMSERRTPKPTQNHSSLFLAPTRAMTARYRILFKEHFSY